MRESIYCSSGVTQVSRWSFSMLVNSFQKFKENKEQTVIIISHQERVIDLADEIMIIANGKIKNKGPKETNYATYSSWTN